MRHSKERTKAYEAVFGYGQSGRDPLGKRPGGHLRRYTNPSLIAKEGRDFAQTVAEIASIVDGPISGEVKATTTDAAGMIAEGRAIAAIHPNMVVKIPMTAEGLKATKVLSAEGIRCNVTLIFTAGQALLAAKAGAAYVSPLFKFLKMTRTLPPKLLQQVCATLFM